MVPFFIAGHKYMLRTLKSQMDMSLFQLDRKAVDEMDSNLTEGQEMEILYHELIKTIPQNYLDMESVR